MKNNIQTYDAVEKIPNSKLPIMDNEKRLFLLAILKTGRNDRSELWKKIGNNLRQLRQDLGYRTDDIAELLDLNPTTITNHETANGKIALETLLDYCSLYNCDLFHLMGKYEESFSDNHALCSATGLSEAAIMKLKGVKDMNKVWDFFSDDFSQETKDYLEESQSDSMFFKLINHIIEQYKGYQPPGLFNTPIDFLGRKTADDSFPTNDIVAYMEKLRRSKAISHHDMYDTLVKIREEIRKEHPDNPIATKAEVAIKLSDRGYTEEQIGIIHKETRFLSDFDEFNDREKRNDRLVLAEELSRFLRSDCIEGGNDGDNN